MVYNNIFVNNFMFCDEHGSEFCNKCFCDHRLTNNIGIEEELASALQGKVDEFDADNRRAIEAFKAGAVLSKRAADSVDSTYKCTKHGTDNCADCFNWLKLVVAEATRKTPYSSAQLLKMETDRTEMLTILKALNIELPPATKLTDDAIDKKMRSALEQAQSVERLFGSSTALFNPSDCREWSGNERRNVLGAISHLSASFEESFGGFAKDVFWEARQALMSLGNSWDSGRRIAVLQDEEQNYAILVRLVSVRVLKYETPALVLLYHRATRATAMEFTLQWLQSQARPGNVTQIRSSKVEQTLILKLLASNEKRLDPDFAQSIKRKGFEQDMKASFLLPIAPLSQTNLGKLHNNLGCVVCGKKGTSRCSQCLSAFYCGIECQKADWKNHKAQCRSLQGGEWHSVTVTSPPENFVITMINRSASATGALDEAPRMGGKPVNVHGESTFLVKIQRSLGGPMLIYDQKRSFQTQLLRSVDPEAFREAMGVMHTGPQGLKIYRWARWTQDGRLLICFDRSPGTEPKW